MKPTKVALIANPASGQNTSFLWNVNAVFAKEQISWDLYLTKKKGDGRSLASAALKTNPDAVAVFGGDGTVLEVASALYATDVPLIIIPAGTANILAKEVGVPLDFLSSLQIFTRTPQLKEIDVASSPDGRTLFLRVEIGIIAEVIAATKRTEKNALGMLAYPLASLEPLRRAKESHYTLTVDGQIHQESGLAMMIANAGNIGIPGISIQPDIHATSGMLDVLLLHSADIRTLFQIGTSSLVGTQKPDTLKHWKGKHISVTIDPGQRILWDDQLVDTQHIELTINSHKLRILT